MTLHFPNRLHWHFLFLVCLFLCRPASGQSATIGKTSGQVWQVGSRRWSIAAERRYAAWVEANVDENFFLRHHIPVDCADVPYGIYWIYARIAHLPAAATTEDGRLIGNWSTLWSRLPTNPVWYRDRRFMASLRYLLDETSTRTMPSDTYPIRIDTNSVMAGAVFLDDGHAGIIGRIVLDGSTFSPIQTWESTLPRRVRKLFERSYFTAWADAETGTGILRFRWPVCIHGHWQYLPKTKQPFYSLQEYAPGFCRLGESFDEAVARRIDPKKYNPAKRAHLIIGSIHRYLLERVPIVLDGYSHCRRGTCPVGSSLWEDYSTPGRDDMIAFEIEHLLKIIKDNKLDLNTFEKSMKKMPIPIGDDKTVSVDYVVRNYHWLSHNPDDSIAARWGLRKCDMIRAQMRDSIRDLHFVEHRYGIKDPSYAAFGHNLYMIDLKRLHKAGADASCRELPSLPK